jgi:hypothetical protein
METTGLNTDAVERCAGSSQSWIITRLDHSKDNGADEGNGKIRRQYAEPVDESHGKAPCVTSLPALTPQATKRFPAQKVSAAAMPAAPTRPAWLKTCEINALMSP